MIFTDGISESHLVASLRDGDQQARARLYTESVGVLSSVCRRYIIDEEDVRDVLHDSYIRIFTTIGKFDYRGNGSLNAWMSRVVVNEALMFLRRSNRIESNSLDDERKVVENLSDDPPEVGRLSADELHMLIRKLPDGYRTVLNLFAIEGKSHKEIAKLLGIKENSSSSQFLRAKVMLTKLIKEYLAKQNEK